MALTTGGPVVILWGVSGYLQARIDLTRSVDLRFMCINGHGCLVGRNVCGRGLSLHAILTVSVAPCIQLQVEVRSPRQSSGQSANHCIAVYYWSACLSTPEWAPAASYMTGWLGLIGNWT